MLCIEHRSGSFRASQRVFSELQSRSGSLRGCFLRYRPLNLLQRLTSAKAALRELRAPQLVILPARFAYAPPRKPLVNHIFKDFANESCF